METRGFLTRVLPPNGGDYFLGSVNGESVFRQDKVPSIDELLAKIEQRSNQRRDVYFATGVYDGVREINAAVAKKALYLDIDCGPGKSYPTKKDGAAALAKFCTDAGMPFPSLLVDSGGGLHAYWPFDVPISRAQWQPLADRLKELCIAHEFAADHPITSDAARIMRVPGTVNYKDKANPRPVRMLRESDENFSLDELSSRLLPKQHSRLAAIANEDDLALPAREFEPRPRYMERIIKHCAVLGHAHETGGRNVAEPLWAMMLNLAVFAEDGPAYIHPLSDKHADYSAERTESKFKYAQARVASGKTGPTTCKTFGMWHADKCAACPYNGKITTPLQLGEYRTDTLPYGFRQDANGLYYTKPASKSTEAVEIRVGMYRFDNLCLAMRREPEGHYVAWVEFDATYRDDFYDDVTNRGAMRVTAVNDIRTLGIALCHAQVFIEPDKMTYMQKFMGSWTNRMQKAKQFRPSFSQLGWVKHDDRDGFVLANAAYWSDGTVQALLPTDQHLSTQYDSRGDKQVWLDIADMVTGQSREAINAAIATAFAAPLIKFTGVSGAMFSIVSHSSGTGKTSALKLAQAVWGCPRRAIHALDDTPKSIAYKLGYLNNLPSYWDEIRMADDVTSFIRLMFQLGQGKERSRLTATVSAQAMGTWTTLITAASNEFLTEYVDHVVKSSNAGRARIFEVEVGPSLGSPIPPMVFAKLDDNYGAIGAEYAAWLATHHDEVERFVGALWKKLSTQLAMKHEERFWVATVVSVAAGAHYANKLGFTKIAWKPLVDWLIAEFRRLRGETEEAHASPEEQGLQFVLKYAAAKRDHLVVCEYSTKKGRGGGNVGAVHIQPVRGQILGYIALKDQVLRITVNEFKEWMRATNGINNPDFLVKKLVDSGIAIKTRGSVTCGIANAVNTNSYTLDIPMKGAKLQSLLKEACIRSLKSKA